MESDGHKHVDGKTCNCTEGELFRQSLDELDFERGIWHAAQTNDLEKVDILLRKGTPVDINDSAGYAGLHYAARNGHIEMCKKLISNGANVNAATRSGKATPLHRAATQGHFRVVEILLNAKANANLQDSDGLTPLHRAILSKNVGVAKLLIPCTNDRLVDKSNRTWRDLAAELNQLDLVL